MATVEPATGSNRDARLDALYERLDAHDMAPYWAVSTDTENDEDAQILKAGKARPYVWKYKDIEPILYEAAELVTMDDSERRSVVLVNPGLAPVRATVTTLYTAYRLNDPREIMPPHRHSINAVRIGLTGASNFTGVEGENIVFGAGRSGAHSGRRLAQSRQPGRRFRGQCERARSAAHRSAERGGLRAPLRGGRRRQARADGAVLGRLFGAGLRPGRAVAPFRRPWARRRTVVADVRLSLGFDARAAGEVPRP